MIAFKLAGAVMLVLACGLLGLEQARRLERRPREVGELRTLLQQLEMEINYTATPLPEALYKTGRRANEPLAESFRLVAAALEEGRGREEAWERGLSHLKLESHMEAEELEILRRLSGNLGLSAAEDQLKQLSLAREQLRLVEERALLAADRGQKLWRSLGFLMGMGFALILF